VSQNIEFPPVENGLDYLESAIGYLQGSPSPHDLKYAVLHLQAAAEVLLKVRLMREHWSLVFRSPDKANLVDFKSGDFQSIGLEEALTRLKGIATVDLPVGARESLKALAKERNKLQHFGLVTQRIAIESIAGKVLDALLCFINEHLRPGADQDELDAFDRIQDIIRDEMKRITALVKARWERINPELDHLAEYVITCPGCLQLALLHDGSRAHCRFCDRIWEDMDDLAVEYAGSVLHLSWYEVQAGAEPPVRACPDCGHETLLADVLVRDDPTNSNWLCLNCGMKTKENDIRPCTSCSELMHHDEDSVICSSCWEAVISRD
jgi:predicted RNA-binding Zn-ribbon protein involved in translation (DUF1610 family)